MTDLDLDLDTIRAAHKDVIPGPWRWHGNVDTQQLYLATIDRGRQTVMTLVRWGLRGAQPMFRMSGERALMERASERPIFAVAPTAISRKDECVYRGDLIGIRNPHADYLARSWEYVEFLLGLLDAPGSAWAQRAEALAEVARLRAALAKARDLNNRLADVPDIFEVNVIKGSLDDVIDGALGTDKTAAP